MRGGFSSEATGRRTRCLKRFIFKKQRAGRLGRADAADSGQTLARSKEFLRSLVHKIGSGFALRILSGRAVFLKLNGYVFDGREWAEDVNFLVRRVDINL